MAETDDLSLLERGAVLAGAGPGAPVRELLTATGADRVAFLHRVVTANVAGTPAGGGARSALLTPKGQVVADFWLLVREASVAVLVDGAQGEATAAALSRYAIMDDFAVAREADFATFSLLGPQAAARLEAVGIAAAADLAARPPLYHVETATAAGPTLLVRARELGAAGFWVAGPAATVAAQRAALEAAGVPSLSPAAAEAARVAALEPRWGAEITSEYFPMEVGLSGSIDYGKGCYLGQEPIVRIRDRGHINWRLVGLDVGGDGSADAADPSPQDALESDVKPRAGRITSAARLPGGRGVAMALLHVSVPVGAEVRIKHGEAVIPARVRAEG